MDTDADTPYSPNRFSIETRLEGVLVKIHLSRESVEELSRTGSLDFRAARDGNEVEFEWQIDLGTEAGEPVQFSRVEIHADTP